MKNSYEQIIKKVIHFFKYFYIVFMTLLLFFLSKGHFGVIMTESRWPLSRIYQTSVQFEIQFLT